MSSQVLSISKDGCSTTSLDNLILLYEAAVFQKAAPISKTISNHIIAITQLASKAAALKIARLKLINTSV